MRVLINSKLNSKYGNLLLFVYIIIIITVRYSTKKERKKKKIEPNLLITLLQHIQRTLHA